MDSDLLANIARVVLLLMAVTVAMLVAKFGWVGLREGSLTRAFGAGSVILLVTGPATTALLRFDQPFLWSTLVYAAGVILAAVTLHRVYVIYPESTRLRLAAARASAGRHVAEKRRVQDRLRADDRISQAGERADSRQMYDESHLDESTAAHDHRVEKREEQDANREHSHRLQDEERRTARADEDKHL